MLLLGRRLLLREFRLDDWQSMQAYDSLDIVCRFQAWGPNTPEQSKAFARYAMDEAKKAPRMRYILAMVEVASGHMIGSCELCIDSTAHRRAEIGYVLNPDFWGKGYATEAANLLLSFGFDQLGLYRIYATCDPRNVASSRVLEKSGMTQEGTMRSHLLLRDGWRDSHLYSILQPEWKGNTNKGKHLY